MKYLYCRYEHGYLVLNYKDESGNRIKHSYLYYTLRERYGLRYKHITVKKLF